MTTTISRTRSRNFAALLAAGASFCLAGPASSHPHVWVTTRTTVVYENGTVTGLAHTWLFDEFYTAGAVEGLDTNKDGKFDRAELAELTKINLEGLKEFEYFTAVKLRDKVLEVGDVKDAYMEVIETAEAPGPQDQTAGLPQATPPTPAQKPTGLWSRFTDAVGGWWTRTIKTPAPAAAGGEPEKVKVLAMHFTLPLKQAVLADAEGFNFTVSDPSMFIWFDLATKTPVQLSAGAPAGCKARIGAAELDEDQKRLAEAFGQGGGIMFGGSKTVTMSCGKG